MSENIEQTYVGRVGRELDVMMNVMLFCGASNVTVSEHSAEAMQAGKPWGCIMCKLLSTLVQKNHCELVLAGQPITTAAGIKAVVLISGVFAAIGFGIHEVINFIF